MPGDYIVVEEQRAKHVRPEDTPEAIRRRGGFDPYGQTLPDWLTYAEYTTTVDGQAVITGSIQDLPLTCASDLRKAPLLQALMADYGASIPLGPGWVFGGSESPVGSIPATTAAPAPAEPGEMSGTGLSTVPTGSTDLSVDAPTYTPASSTTRTTTTLPPSRTPSAFSTGSVPSVPSATSSSSTSLTALRPPLPPSSTSPPLTSSSAPPPNPTGEIDENTSDLVPLLPALLVPLGLLLLAILFGLYLYRRNKSFQPSSITAGDPPRWLRWLPAPFLALLYPSRRGYQSTATPSTPPSLSQSRSRTRTRTPAATSDNIRSPTEKSALLTGFTPHHHRNSSSLSSIPAAHTDTHADNSSSLSRIPAAHTDTHAEHAEHADPSPSAVVQKGRDQTSLIHRLGLGFGLGIFASSPTEPRKPSGFMLEKGIAQGSYTALLPPPRRERSRAGTMDAAGGAGGHDSGGGGGDIGGGGSGSGTGTGTAEQTSSGNLRSIPDEQLFYRVPEGTASSKATSSDHSSYRARAPGEGIASTRAGEGRKWFSRFSYSNVSGLPPGAAAPFWVRTPGESARGAATDAPGEGGGSGSGSGSGSGESGVEGGNGDGEGRHVGEGVSDAMSIAVPDTPGTVSGDGSLGGSLEFGRRERTRWSDAERLSFPIPPPSARVSPAGSPRLGGMLGVDDVSRRNSVASSHPSFHTAPLDLDDPDPVSQRDAGAPIAAVLAGSAPIGRTHRDYRHAPLSVFGSTPTTPTRTPLHSPSQALLSGTDHSTDHLHAGPLASPLSPLSPLSLSSSTPLGSASLPWSPFIPAPVDSAAHDRSEDADTVGPMRGLFVISPPPGAESPGGASAAEQHRTSFVGEPLVDVRLSSGVPVARRAVGEFGEPLRPGPENTPTLGSTSSGHVQERSSETASIYSHPSRAASGNGTGSSGSHSSTGHARAVSGALRGRRSRPAVLRADQLPPSSFDVGDTHDAKEAKETSEVPLLPPLTPHTARKESTGAAGTVNSLLDSTDRDSGQGRKGWFEWRRAG